MVSRLVWNFTIHCLVHKIPPPPQCRTLCRLNEVHVLIFVQWSGHFFLSYRHVISQLLNSHRICIYWAVSAEYAKSDIGSTQHGNVSWPCSTHTSGSTVFAVYFHLGKSWWMPRVVGCEVHRVGWTRYFASEIDSAKFTAFRFSLGMS
jgi:hypothetical protein